MRVACSFLKGNTYSSFSINDANWDEREQEPKYGFFILNRMGMDDYIRCLVPTDEMSINGSILMYRTIKNDPRRRGDDGEEVIGFWIMDTNVREPMSAVMMRLLSYVKKGQPYPLEYR